MVIIYQHIVKTIKYRRIEMEIKTISLRVNWPGRFTAGDNVIFRDEYSAMVMADYSGEIPEGRVPIALHGDKDQYIHVLPTELEKCHEA